MKDKITPKEVDAIASYVEACMELDLEPFFGPDESLSFQHSGERTYYLGDRCHFRSALVSFRRLWMQKEPSHWIKVCNILTRSNIPRAMREFAQHHRSQVEFHLEHGLSFPGIEKPLERVIDLWLNTVFAHGGIEGPNKRREFERIIDTAGAGPFEFVFRNLVKWIGNEFRNISNLAAKPALDHFDKDFGLKSSFRINAAFGSKLRERTRNGDIIIRQASSEFYNEESLENRLQRILKRDDFRDLASVLKGFDHHSNSTIFRLVVCSASLTEFIEQLGGAIEGSKDMLTVPTPPFGGLRVSFGTTSSPLSGARSERVNVYVGKVSTTGNGVIILEEKFANFRKNLMGL